MSLRNIKRPKLTETVAERLAAAIRRGEYRPGDRLPTEAELRDRLGVSRNVVREAINELRARGLVVTRQGSGSVVSGEVHKPIRQVMADLMGDEDGAEGKLLELREVLETRVAALAAQRADTSQVAEMESLLRRFEAAGGDLQACAELDVAFHAAIGRAARNELFGLVLTPLNELLVPTRLRALQRSGPAVAAAMHRAILAAIRAGNGALAARRMAEHIAYTVKAWKRARRNNK